jgi:signal transduction histidine kinase
VSEIDTDRFWRLLAINRAIAAAMDHGALLQLVVDRTAEFLESRVAVLVLGTVGGDATVAASVGLDSDTAAAFRAPLNEAIGQRLYGYLSCAPERFLAVPVLYGGTIHGILAVCREHVAFDDDDAQLLSALGDQVAIALANADHVRRLAEAVSALSDVDRRKDEFLGMLSHELRNPLAPIRTAIYLLSKIDPQSESAARARLVIQRQTEQLTRLIDDLLDTTRIARGKITVVRERIDVTNVVRRVAEDYRSTLTEQGLTFQIHIPPRPLWIDADRTRIAQVIGNLLHNAAKFTTPGGEVVLAIRAFDASVEISVRDTGSGIPAELTNRIFEPFVQGEGSLARTRGGLGLGLALVKAVVELHGGAVRVASEGPDRGAEFVISLPLAPPRRLARRPPPKIAVAVAPHRVLVIDDNRDAAESLAELAELFGHTADVAYDAASGLELLRETHPDVVFCDIGLPDMNGYEFAKRARAALGHHVRLIAVSGYAQPSDVTKALDAGFDSHVAKPPDPALIDRLLGNAA